MDLNNPIWKTLKGGYGSIYDASIVLRNLEETESPESIEEISNELWQELHHQGDVGLASYYSLPHIVKILQEKNLNNWKLTGLCSVIEQQRHTVDNPDLPEDLIDDYTTAISKLKALAIKSLNEVKDKTTLIVLLSTIATCSGHFKLGIAISEMENDDLIDEFLKQI